MGGRCRIIFYRGAVCGGRTMDRDVVGKSDLGVGVFYLVFCGQGMANTMIDDG